MRAAGKQAAQWKDFLSAWATTKAKSNSTPHEVPWAAVLATHWQRGFLSHILIITPKLLSPVKGMS
jgi:hypothetical protein